LPKNQKANFTIDLEHGGKTIGKLFFMASRMIHTTKEDEMELIQKLQRQNNELKIQLRNLRSKKK